MIVGARHPRPKPNEKICCTFDRKFEHDLTKFPFLKMGDDVRSVYDDDLRSISDDRRIYTFSGRFRARVARPYGVWIVH